MRALLPLAVVDESGEDVESATIVYTQTDGSPIGSLYSVASGGAPETTHETNQLGEIVRYRDVPIRASYTVNGGTAKVADFSPDPAAVVIDGDTQARSLDGYTGTDPVLKLRSRNAAGTGLLVANTNDDTVLTVTRAGGNDVVIIGDDGTAPTTNQLYVTKASATSYDLVHIKQTTGAAGIINSGLRVDAIQTVAGVSNAVGVLSVAQRTGSATLGGTAQAFLGVVNTTVGGSQNVACAFAASSDASNGGVRNGAAFCAYGAAGWTDGFLHLDTDGFTVLFQTTQTGGLVAGSYLALGATPAAAGAIRLTNATSIAADKTGGVGDITMARTDASNNVILGDTNSAVGLYLGATTSVTLQVTGANIELFADTSGLRLGRAAGTLGFYGGSGAAKAAVTGAKGGNAALTSLLAYLAARGLLTDSTT